MIKFCKSNKVWYPSERTAWKASINMFNKRPLKRVLNVYKCNYCGMFHLTSQNSVLLSEAKSVIAKLDRRREEEINVRRKNIKEKKRLDEVFDKEEQLYKQFNLGDY